MKVLILGGSGFVGRNLVECLCEKFDVMVAARNPATGQVYFDINDRASYPALANLKPDVIINAAAFGVRKTEQDLETMYNVNYIMAAKLYEHMVANGFQGFWFQLGTAFEYDLSKPGGITESTPCLPATHYGISKLMFSRYLMTYGKPGSFTILRPFGMYGKFEDSSKFFPMLLTAQFRKEVVRLSSGMQKRDYFFVDGLGQFMGTLIRGNQLSTLPRVMNLGSGEALSLREYASILSHTLSDYDPSLWQWDTVPLRENESSLFYNASDLAVTYGFACPDQRHGFLATVNHYKSKIHGVAR
ncbi:MAG TPA: NAD(P)-dependent oxidoreductase [Cyclobacteriaceae bacterium]|nr:NAD(P)-dependent oxidoreductase [Cyclobacteriaceae bacterium]